MRLATTIGGAGVIRGDLTPECAEFVQTVLDALSAPAGADDDRSHEQRYHDALAEAMRRLLAAGLLPERSGQPVKVWVYISLADLMRIEGSSALLEEWTGHLRTRWAGHRAAAAEAGGHQGLWLDGDAAEAIACDAAVAPVVVGDVDPAAFGDLVRLCVQLDRLRRHGTRPARLPVTARPAGHGGDGRPPGRPGPRGDGGSQEVPAAFGGARSREALEQAVIGKAVELLSGPGGLARSCGASCSAPGSAGRACRWTSAAATPSRPGSATRSGTAPGTANGPAAAASPPGPARSTTPGTKPTAARPASPAASCSVTSTTRS